jgi:two-component system KDP operon response regulator KdpE
MTRILLVDDDPQLARALAINLRARGYEVTTARTGSGALQAASRDLPELAIIDLGLPDLNGIEVVEGLRGWTTLPILVLSARDTQGDKVTALDAGADDYLTKPFGMDELLARIRAALRRAQEVEPAPLIVTADFTIDIAAAVVERGGERVRLTPTEWQLLALLARNEGKLVSQRQLLQEVWGPNFATETNYLRVYMAQLRRKLEPDPAHPKYLQTEHGMGYRLTTE